MAPAAPAAGGLIFFTHGLCPYAQRVALTLNWKGIDHKVYELDLSNKPSWYRQRLGTSLVPAIEIDGTPHCESLDIVKLCDKQYASPEHKPLMPSDSEKAKAVDALVSFASRLESAGWNLLGGAWNFPSKGGQPSASTVKNWAAAVDVLTASLDKWGGPYLVGNTPTMADAALAPFLARFELSALQCRGGYDVRAESPKLGEYLSTLDADASWQKTYPDRKKFGDAIARFGSLDYFDYHSCSLANPVP